MRSFRSLSLAAIAAVVALLAGCGSGGGEVTLEAKTAPAAMIEAANLDGVRSGLVEGSFAIRNPAERNLVGVHLSAGFDRRAGESLPPFYVALGGTGQRHGHSFEFNDRLFFQPTEAVLVYGPAYHELAYKPGKAELAKVEGRLEEAEGEGGAADVSACLEATRGLRPETLLVDPAHAGRLVTPDGTHLYLVSSGIDSQALLDLMAKLAADPGCRAQLEALGLPPLTELELGPGGEGDQATLGVDRHGNLRYLKASLGFAGAAAGEVELTLELTLREVNKPVAIEGAAEARPLADLLHKFGVEPEAVAQASGDELIAGFLEGLGDNISGRVP